jgi:hypothetical protein
LRWSKEAIAISTVPRIADRFQTSELVEPGVKKLTAPDFSFFPSNGVQYDDLFFPSWMSGDWDCTQTLVAFTTPLGARYLAGPSGERFDVAEKTIKQESSLVGKPVGPFHVKWLTVSQTDRNGLRLVVEDRAFNTAARFNAFSGKTIVKSVEYIEVGGANKVNFGGSPLPTTITRFDPKVVGSAAQKTFSNNRNSETDQNTGMWSGFEFSRSIFVRNGKAVFFVF